MRNNRVASSTSASSTALPSKQLLDAGSRSKSGWIALKGNRKIQKTFVTKFCCDGSTCINSVQLNKYMS